MTSVKLEMAGKTWVLPVTWQSAIDLSDQYADPLDISTDMLMAEAAAHDGRDYIQRFPFNLRNCVKIVSIAAGVSEEEIGEAVMKEGTGKLVNAAVSFVVAIVAAGSNIEAEDDGEKKT